ncbi:MAG: TIGR03086 family metal-binding protein [Actinomycetota bacterium]|nr:TIGR03086 family metal-binding protein [Actinomycetota bacterium]
MQRLDTVAQRYRTVAARFTAVVDGVGTDAWANPTPCAGWVARDVVRHLVEWVPPFLAAGAGLQFTDIPSADDDPLAAWQLLDATLQATLDAPDTASRQFVHPQAGTHPLDQAIDMFILGDVLVHTWDLARATGQDERLDADAVHRMRRGLEQMGDVLAASGHYAGWKPVADDADEQTRLLALTGRTT